MGSDGLVERRLCLAGFDQGMALYIFLPGGNEGRRDIPFLKGPAGRAKQGTK